MPPQPKLFTPTRLGDLTLAHRIVMAPLTRNRASAAHVPLPDIVAEYYAQRACVPGTLLISEATYISPQAGGYANVPGIWNEEQIAAWKKVTDAVHAQGSYIYMQLWALGRAAVPSILSSEFNRPCTGPDSPYVSCSPIPLSARPPEDPAPRALTLEEIAQYVDWYAQAAENAVKHAGFDGVEVHGANGYLVEQFLQDVSNKRTDGYGGSVENRARFALEVLDAIVKRIGPRKTAMRLSPWNPFQDMCMADPVPTYTYLIRQILSRHPDLAYLHVTEKQKPLDQLKITSGFIIAATEEFVEEGTENDFIRELWTKNGKQLITAGGYTRESALHVAETKGDLIAFGRLFISNPDLVYRLKHGLPAERGDWNLYYESTPKGYIDYPFSPEFLEEKRKAGESGDRSRI